jgi:hypothetical protein
MERSIERSLITTLERMAVALEDMAKDPVVEVEATPPICPHCGQFNPQFYLEMQDQLSGPLGECVLYGRCGKCQQRFYAVPLTWHMHKLRENVDQELKERAELRDEYARTA